MEVHDKIRVMREINQSMVARRNGGEAFNVTEWICQN